MVRMSSTPPPPRKPADPSAPRRLFGLGWKTWAGLAVGLLIGWLIFQGPAIAAQAEAGAAYGARMACSCRYVQGRPIAQCERDKEPGMAMIRYDDDPGQRTVTASVPMLARAHARYQPATGCLFVDADGAATTGSAGR